jgi:hypothetical protein
MVKHIGIFSNSTNSVCYASAETPAARLSTEAIG